MQCSSTSAQDLSFLWLEITAKCNLECSHCYAHSGPRQPLLGSMRTHDWLRVMRECHDLGCRQVQFIGGEPTLHPDLAEMLSFASQCGYEYIEVFTNALSLNEEMLTTFVKHRVNLAVSFYSDNASIHDAITSRQGSFERTIKNLKRLVVSGLHVRAGIIETEVNSGHARAARRFLESLGITNIKVDFERGVGRGSKKQTAADPMAELCGECWKGKLCVTAQGRIYPCVFSRFADVGSTAKGIESVLASAALSDFRANLRTYKLNESCNPRCSPCSPDVFIECSPPCNPSSRCMPSLADCSPRSPCLPNCAPGSGCRPSRV